MRDNHIIEILERSSFANLSQSDRESIQTHAASCADCARAYKAAMVSESLLKERGLETVAPPPFFHTRVLAALRERQSEPAFTRLWRAAGALASSMVAAVALLAVLSFLIPSQSVDPSALNAYSAEEVILNQGDAGLDQVSDEQVLTTLYDTDEETR